MSWLLNSLLTFLVLRTFGSNTTNVESNTEVLLQELFNRTYDVNVKPSDTLTTVTITPNTFLLLSMDQTQETILFSQEFLLKWYDPILHWNRTLFDYNREWIKISVSRVWVPDVIFTKRLSVESLLDEDMQMADLRYNGEIRTSLPAVVSTSCPLNIQDFPHDVQECNISMGSWAFDRTVIVVQSSVDEILPLRGRFEGNSEWELLSIRAFRTDSFEYSLGTSFSEITYTVTLQRKPVYYVLVIQAPTFILCTITIFGLFSPNSNENERLSRVELCLNMFAAISMMLQLVSDMMPKASRLPLLGNYIIAEIFVVTAATIAAIVIQHVHHHVHTNATCPPKWLRCLVLCDCMREEFPSKTSSVSSMDVPENIIAPVSLLKSSLHKTAFLVRDTLQEMSRINENQLLWLKILDKTDLMCLILFQVANVVITIVYWK
ncbi:Neurotransmitter-gated ion-channel ligand-binding domain-containing protein [Caenorhabditis elegans]|uniref:Neurotransmitter-gated ion-channel ligand-binding domain-containing protein n=1 Tax=Caenorhabditis elegans TaxID=6239 RepID=O61520_CAEEL|nr:Neurotransmitter-gated ion-channel ligand-binding domain-containing protein [Caenorhabditis elegans]CCD68535.3 Neurotransmitter-gated ion-channel ligand-binding domain-containing protein [Caenorhabditis elegans]|eukprot:NP_501411.4 Ligand-Gated ion Channel [Caenorhabditis elegans]